MQVPEARKNDRSSGRSMVSLHAIRVLLVMQGIASHRPLITWVPGCKPRRVDDNVPGHIFTLGLVDVYGSSRRSSPRTSSLPRASLLEGGLSIANVWTGWHGRNFEALG